jgi:hypothetical protein
LAVVAEETRRHLIGATAVATNPRDAPRLSLPDGVIKPPSFSAWLLY